MNKIIGGLLVIALLSKPSVLKVDYLAYEIFKIQSNIIKVITKEFENKEKQDITRDINDLLIDNDDNTRTITSLIKEKNFTSGKIKTMMELKAMAKIPFEEKQITGFTAFTNQYSLLSKSISDNLKKIESKKDLRMVTSEILHNDSSLDIIFNELKEINEIQWETIQDLNSVVDCAERTLAIL
jgi:hypothetical protein